MVLHGYKMMKISYPNGVTVTLKSKSKSRGKFEISTMFLLKKSRQTPQHRKLGEA